MATQRAVSNHRQTLTHPLESLSAAAAIQTCGRNAGGQGFRISLEIRYDRVYEPYGHAGRNQTLRKPSVG